MANYKQHPQKVTVRDLVQNTDLSKTEISKKTGVSKNSISTWCKQHGWGNENISMLRNLLDYDTLKAFADHVRQTDPDIYAKLREQLTRFVAQQKDHV
jgi:uncharacterized protein YjcR